MARLIVSWIVSGTMAIGALWVLIFGPRPDASIPADRQQDTIIRYWEKWPGFEGVAMRQIVEDFNNSVGKEKHIFVEYLTISLIDEKTLVAISAGNPPDIAGLWDHEVAPYACQHVTIPLDDLAAEHGITEGYYKPVYWKSCHYNGKLYALISTPASVALFYNQKIFHESADQLKKANLDPDSYPKTLDELDRYAAALDTYKKGVDGKDHVDRVGYLPMEPGWWIYNMPIWFGKFIWDDDTHKFLLTEPEATKAFNWVQSYSKKFGTDSLTEFSNSVQNQFNSPNNPFMLDQVVMEQQGPWFANYIHQNRPAVDDEWAACPFPSAIGQKDVTWCPYDTLVIPTGTKHPREAFEFIAYVNRQDVMEKLCASHCKNSPLMNVSEHFLDDMRKNHNRAIDVFEELARSPNAYSARECPINAEVKDEVTASVQNMVLLKQPAEVALKELNDRLQADYEDFARKQARRDALEEKGL